MAMLATGIFGRACAAMGSDKNSDKAVKREAVLQEASALRESLTDKLISLKSSQGVGIGNISCLSVNNCIYATLAMHNG